MKEVTKPNDIFVSTLLNPSADIPDLLANGVNGENTGLLPYDTYKNSKFVQKAFTDQDGVFDTQRFAQVYNIALLKYDLLQSVLLYSDLNQYTKYNENDIYAPIQSQKTEKTYELKKVRNPFRVSEGVSSLFGKGEAEYSNRELAQMHKVWDSENEKWLDYTAEEQGFLGLKYLGRKALVYAAWDEDGVHFDPFTGKEVRHKKGEWKTDDNGMYYTETIGKKQGYGKEFVAYSDILTKEDSWANNIDFFDSDDKNKSIGGTVAKTVAAFLPYIFPVARGVWGGITAAINLASVLPTFAKMAEGLAVQDGETGFTKSMNAIENYFKKFDDSHSDAGKSSIINFETIMGTLGDVYGQLYQMRAAASLSNLYTKQFTKAQSESFENFAKKFGNAWAQANAANKAEFAKNPDSFFDLWKSLAENTPEMKLLIDKLSKLSKALSLGYMALTSSADVYEDAIQGGYDRRMAGLAGFIATAGLFGIMYNNKMGDWFLDATTGYKSDVSRRVMRKTMQPYYDKIAEAADKLVDKIPTEEKVSILSKLYSGIFKDGPKKIKDLLVYGSEEFWKNGLIEGVEEITEEAVMDATKGVFDFLSHMGIGKNSETASFGGWDNVFSSEGALRYLMSFLGGTLGGTMFEFQRSKIQPWIDSKVLGKAPADVRYSIILEIMNGNTQELLDEIDRMCAADTQTLILNDNTNKPLTRGLAIANSLKQHVRFIEGIVMDEGIKLNELSSDKLIKRVVRTKMLQPVIEEAGLIDMINADFTKMVDEFVLLKTQLVEKVGTSDDDDKDKKKENKEESTTDSDKKESIDQSEETEIKVSDTLKSQINAEVTAKKQQIVDFLNGSKEEEYLKTALLYLHPALRQASLAVDKYSWTKAKYGVDYSTLPETEATLSKKQIDEEYKEWRAKSDNLDKFRTVGVFAFDEMEKEFSPVFEEYARSKYGDTRKVTMDTLLRDSNFTMGERAAKDLDWRHSLILISLGLKEAGLKGVSLEDILQIGEGTRQKIIDSLVGLNDLFLSKTAELFSKANQLSKAEWDALPEEAKAANEKPEFVTLTADDVKNLFAELIKQRLNNLPLETITPQILNNILLEAHYDVVVKFVELLLPTLGNDVDLPTAKAAVDELLLEMGYTPIEEELEGDTRFAIIKYISLVTTPKTDITENIDLTASVLEEYLGKEEIIDGEVARQIKYAFYKEIEQDTKDQSFKDLFIEDEFLPIYYPEGDAQFQVKNWATFVPSLLTRVKLGFDNNEDLTTIVTDWLYGPNGQVDVDSIEFKLFKLELMPDVEKRSVLMVVDRLLALPRAGLYDVVRKKTQKINPLFEKLRTFGMKVFDGKDMIIFDLLEAESKYMSELPSIGEYIRQGVTKEAIENFISKLNLLKAILIGMEDSGVDPDHQISYNVQLKRWSEKWKKGDSDKYKTISTHEITQIVNDLDLLIEKLTFTQTLIETNTASKRLEDLNIQIQFESQILNAIQQASELTIEGVSVLPSDDELNKQKTDSAKVALIEHTLYEKIQELIKKGVAIDTILELLFNGFEVNKEVILNGGLSSNGLTKDANISPYDFFVWLTTTIAHDSYDFSYNYKETLKLAEYKFMPFFVQEESAKILYSFAKDKQGIHKKAVEWLYKGAPEATIEKSANIFFLNGIAGAGKTRAVMAVVNHMLGASSIWVAAPNDNLVANLKASLETFGPLSDKSKLYNKDKLLAQILTAEGLTKVEEAAAQDPEKGEGIVKAVKDEHDLITYKIYLKEEYIQRLDKKDKPKYIFIDEITHFNLAEIKALEMFAEINGIKIITAGDTLQKGAMINGLPSNISDIFSWKSPAMTLSVRSSNIHKKNNIDLLQQILRRVEAHIHDPKIGYRLDHDSIRYELDAVKEISYYLTEAELHGDKLVDFITVEDLKTIKAASKGKSVAVITLLDANNRPMDGDLVSKLQDAGFKEGDYVLYSPDDFSPKAVQGAEADYVIINDMPDATEDNYQNLINLYTYLSRSLVGSLVNIGTYADSLHLINNPIPYTSDYSVPGLDALEEEKQKKITALEDILGDYKPEVSPSELKKETTASEDTESEEEESPIQIGNSSKVKDPKDLKQIEDIIDEGESKIRKKSSPRPEYHKANPEDTRATHMYGYGFYTRTGVKKAGGRFKPVNFGTHLDLDGLLQGKTYIKDQAVQGFNKFKNLLALYGVAIANGGVGSDIAEEKFYEGLKDPDILYFFWAACPSISDSDNIQDRQEEIFAYLKKHLLVEDEAYVYAKKYNPDVDSAEFLVESNPNALSKKDLWLGYGKRITLSDDSGQTLINQFITVGALPKLGTIVKEGLVADSYSSFIQKADKDVTEADKLVIYEMPDDVEIKPGTGLIIRKAKDPNTFVSLESMMKTYGITFQPDKSGKPFVGLIDGKADKDGVKMKIKVDGEEIETFSFLHFIAQTEKNSRISYKDRIKLLEDAFVKDGKLTISGKYFAIAKFSINDDSEYTRVLILEPTGWSYLDAIRKQRELSDVINKHKTSSDEIKLGVLELKAEYLSQASQMHLLTAVFKDLGCINENGLAIGDGVLPYVSKVLSVIVKKLPNAQRLIKNVDQLIDLYKNPEDGNPKDFDMQFISDLIRETRYMGVLLIDQLVSITASGTGRVIISHEEGKRPDVRDLSFDLDQYAFREFGIKFTEQDFTLSYGPDPEKDTYVFSPYAIDLRDFDYKHLGLLGYSLQMPRLNIEETAFARIGEPLTKEEIDLKASEIDYTNLELDTEEEVKKPKLKNSSVEKMRKMFDPEVDVVRKRVDPKRFYVFNPSLTPEEAEDRRKYVIKASSKSNYFELRVGDTILLFGDTSTTYRISYIYRGGKGQEPELRFDLVNGKPIGDFRFDAKIRPSDVSSIISREWGSFLNKKGDYYLSQKWGDLTKKTKDKETRKSKIYTASGLTKADMERFLSSDNSVLIYAVTNDDSSVFDPIEGETFADTTPHQHITGDVDRAFEFIEELKLVDNINGIVIVSMSPTSAADYTSPNEAKKIGLLKEIRDNWIRAYISINGEPKFTEIPKSEKEEKAVLDADSALGKAMSVLATFKSGTKTELLDLLKAAVAVDNLSDLEAFKQREWFKYTDGTKWYVFPKLKLVETLNEENKVAILSSIKSADLKHENIVIIVGQDNVKTIEAIYDEDSSTDDKYAFTPTDGGKTQFVKKQTVDLLWGIGYMKKDSTSPAPKKSAKPKPTSVPVPPPTESSTDPTPTPPKSEPVPVPPPTGSSTDPTPVPPPTPVGPTVPVPAPSHSTEASSEYTFNLMEKRWINQTFSDFDDSVKPEIFTNIKEVIANIAKTRGYTSPQEAFLDMTKIISRISSLYNGEIGQKDIYDIIINNLEGLIDTYKKSCEAFPEKSLELILTEMLTIDDEGNLDVTELQNEC